MVLCSCRVFHVGLMCCWDGMDMINYMIWLKVLTSNALAQVQIEINFPNSKDFAYNCFDIS